MQKLTLAVVTTLFLIPAHGAYHDRGGGFIYDDVLDVTWVQDVNLTAAADWDTQVAWADSLVLYDSVRDVYWDDWRLANSDLNGNGLVSDCTISAPDPCSDNELATHLGSPTLLSSGLFPGLTSLTTFLFWSGTERSPATAWAVVFFIGGGVEWWFKTNLGVAWAVRDGDVANVPMAVGVDVTNSSIHPHHDGSPSAVAGLNDIINVNVFGSSIANGDVVDFFVSAINHATVEFGPAEGGYDPLTTPITTVDVNSDGDNDAQYQFLTGDAGISCGETAVLLTGELSSGQLFEGSDSITTDCAALCHN